MDFGAIRDVLDWLKNVLTDVVKGIQETYKYWKAKTEEIDEAI